MRASLVVIFSVLAFAGVGCTGDPAALGWELEFSEPALLDRAVVVEALIFEGDCSAEGDEVFSTEILMGEASTALAPNLPDGTWAFVGRARDTGCVKFAEGCTVVTLPTPGPVVVTLSPRATEVPACPSGRCSAGQCLDTPIDAGPGDACLPTEVDCSDTVDNDCNGDIDCDDAACTDAAVCAACASVTCGDCETCRGGECFPVDDETSCGPGTCWGGSCCVGCWDGISCRLGGADAVCGRGGALCGTCEGCGTCGDGTCVAGVGTEGDPCAAGAGVCALGVCCTRCTVDGTCVAGNTPAACGVGGGVCTECSECSSCVGGACAPADGPACTGGICHVGACCTGCWNGSSCEDGATAMACGVTGGMCATCTPCSDCTSGACVPKSNGDTCTSPSGQNGICRGAALVCCAGCWDGTSCQPGNSDPACGDRGRACQTCDGVRTTCDGRFCVPI